MKYKIEEASVRDAEGILNVQKATWLCTYPNEKHNITKKDVQDKVRTFKLERWKKNITNKEKNRANIWIAEVEDQIAAFGSGMKGAKTNRLTAIYVLSNHHRKGIGKALMAKVFEFLGNAKPIVVEVVSYNKVAINFYKKFGFVKYRDIPPTKHALLPSGKMMPEIEMIRSPK